MDPTFAQSINDDTLTWLIPNDGPDLTCIHRIMSAFPIKTNVVVDVDTIDDTTTDSKLLVLLDSIVCQVKLKVEKKTIHTSITSNTTTNLTTDVVDDIYGGDDAKISSSSSSSHTSCNNNNNNNDSTTTIYLWTLETLNRYGIPTLPIQCDSLFPMNNIINVDHNRNRNHTTNTSIDVIQQQQQQQQHDEFYIMIHTHEYSISGNRPFAIGILSSSSSSHCMENNHIYTIRWVTSPMNFSIPLSSSSSLSLQQQQQLILKRGGHVSIHFQYSSGMGYIPPPFKSEWIYGGAIQTYYICRNVIYNNNNVPSSLVANNNNSNDNNNSNMEEDENSNATTTTTMKNDYSILNLEPFQIPTIHKRLSSYDIILAYGDSILEQLIASQEYKNNNNNNARSTDSNMDTSSSSSSLSKRKIHYGPKIASPLNNTRTLTNILNEFDTFVQPFLVHNTATNNNRTINNNNNNNNNHNNNNASIAVLLNSALWDVLSDEAISTNGTLDTNELIPSYCQIDPWIEHINTLYQYLSTIRQKYPTIHIYWLLPTAVHIHRVHLLSDPMIWKKAPQKIARTKYMSASRTLQLYLRQKDMIALLNSSRSDNDTTTLPPPPIINVLDIYEATYLSADWTLPGDGRHYRPEFNTRMLSWFY